VTTLFASSLLRSQSLCLRKRCSCIGPRAWCLGRSFVFARYSLRSRIQ